MFRNLMDCALSLLNIRKVLPAMFLLWITDKLSGYNMFNLAEKLSTEIPSSIHHNFHIRHPIGIFIKESMLHLYKFKRMKKNNLPTAGVLYEDLVSNSE